MHIDVSMGWGYRRAQVRKQESTKKEGDPQLVVKGWEWVGETKKEQDWTGLGMTSEGSRIVGVVARGTGFVMGTVIIGLSIKSLVGVVSKHGHKTA